MIPYQWTSTILAIAIAVSIILLARRDRLHFRFTPWWLVTSLGILVFGFFPTLIDVIGNILGISYPPIILVILGMGMLLAKLLTMDIDRSRHERHIRRLSQRLAILDGIRNKEEAQKRASQATEIQTEEELNAETQEPQSEKSTQKLD